MVARELRRVSQQVSDNFDLRQGPLREDSVCDPHQELPRFVLALSCPLRPALGRRLLDHGEQFRRGGHPFPYRVLDLGGVIRHVEYNCHRLALRCDEGDIVVVSQSYGHSSVPSIHHAVRTPDPQHPIFGKRRLVRQLPRRLKPARILMPFSLPPNGILHARRAMGVDLGGAGAKVRFLVERSCELDTVLQQHRYV